MKKQKLFIGAALLMAMGILVFIGCSNDPDPGTGKKSDQAVITSIKVAGVDVEVKTPITGAQWDATDSLNSTAIPGIGNALQSLASLPNITLLANATITVEASARATVKYGRSSTGTVKPESFQTGNTITFTNMDYLYIQVTSENGAVINYYRIRVQAQTHSAIVASISIGGVAAVIPERSSPGGTIAEAIPAILYIQEATPNASGYAIVAPPDSSANGDATVKWTKVAANAPAPAVSAFGTTTPLVLADGDLLYVEVTAAGDATVKGYYKTIVSFLREATIKYGNPEIKASAQKYVDPKFNAATVLKIDRVGNDNLTDYYLAAPDTFGEARLLWDEDGVYAYVKVTDAIVAGAGSGQAHLGDSIEFFITEQFANGTDNYGSRGNQYRVDGEDGTLSGDRDDSITAWRATNQYSQWLTDDGYAAVFQVPWMYKNVTPLEGGKVIGIDVQLNVSSESGSRDGVMVWNNTRRGNYQNSAFYGKVTLDLDGHVLIVNAAQPSITLQPVGGVYIEGETIPALSVDASVIDTGTLTYEWFKADSISATGTSVGTGKTVTPEDLEPGDYFYYAVVTNTNTAPAINGSTTATTSSARARIQVFEEGSVLVEQLTLRQSVAIYQFKLPADATYGDYVSITVQYKMDTENFAKAVRFNRLYGNYKPEDFQSTGNIVYADFSDAGGKNAPYIYDDIGEAAITAANATADAWFEQTYRLVGNNPHANFAPANKPVTGATGPFYFGIGIPGNWDSTPGLEKTQLVKDVTMVHKDDPSKNVVSRSSGLGGMAFAGYGGDDGMNGNNRVWMAE
jgi:hypothetical protein